MTSLRDKLRTRAQPLLEPGEQIQEIFPARTTPGAMGGFFPRSWLVAATDRNIVVFGARRMSQTMPRVVAARLPRTTRLGPVSGGMFAEMHASVGGDVLLVQKRFFEDVERADARGSGNPADQHEA